MTIYFIFEEKLGNAYDSIYKITHSLEEANALVDSSMYWSKAFYIEINK